MTKPQTTLKTLTSTDRDAIRVVDTFKSLKRYPTHSEAMEKLLMRAEKLNLHKLPDADFEALVDGAVGSLNSK